MTTLQWALIAICALALGILLAILCWHSVRAANGNPASQALLGDSFSRQVILSPLGVRLLKASIVQGYVPAMYYYGYYLQLMTQRQHTALRWYKRAVKRGNADAAFALAMYGAEQVLDFQGKLSRQHAKRVQATADEELILALSWLYISQVLGHPSARFKVAQVSALIEQGVLDAAKAQGETWLAQHH